MLNRIIANRLKESRRLVIPKLGAFIVKEPDGKILFSELLRGDDGVLRGLIKASGVGDIEAAGVIDRYVFEVRNTLDRGRSYEIGDLGALRRSENGAIVFVQSPTSEVRPNASVRSGHPYVAPAAYSAETEREQPSANETTAPRRVVKRRRKADAFIVAAVIIAVLAVAVMVYGYFRANEQGEVSLREMFIPSAESEPVDLGAPSDGVSDGASGETNAPMR